MNYFVWNNGDFKYIGQELIGFSKKGLLKNKMNKNIVIPETTPEGEVLTSIGKSAFRNIDRAFEIESVELPDTIVKIGDWAFQFNDIAEFKMPRDLEEMGMGVLMMSNLKKLEFNKKIRIIDQACFFFSELGEVKIPKSIEKIYEASFRQCGITKLEFEEGAIVDEIRSLGFADNQLTEVTLPKSVKRISGHQTFGNNHIKEMRVLGEIEDLGFQTFLGNEFEAVVRVENNVYNLMDDQGNTYTVNPEVKASEEDKIALKEAITPILGLDPEKYIERFSMYRDSLIKLSKELLLKNSSRSEVLGKIREINFLKDRTKLSELLKYISTLKRSDFSKEEWDHIEEVCTEVDAKIMIYNLNKEKLEELYEKLRLTLTMNLQSNKTMILEGM